LEAQLTSINQTKNVDSASPSQTQLRSLFEQYQNGRYNDAEKVALLITQEFPEHQFAWKVLGALFEKAGRKSEALNANQKAVQLVPEDAEAHYNLSNTLQALDRLAEAEASHRQAITLKPDYTEAHNNLGIVLKERQKLGEAEKSFRQAIALSPDYGEAHFNLGNLLKDQDRLEETVECFRQAIALRKDLVQAHSNLGVVLHRLGERDLAIESLLVALKSGPESADLFNLGVMLEGIVFFKPMPHLMEFVFQLLEKETLVRPDAISGAAISLLKFDPIIKEAFGKYAADNIAKSLKEIIEGLTSVPLLLKLMKICPFSDLEFEALFKGVRSETLRDITRLENNPEILDFQIALALQCFTNEYLYDIGDAEKEALIDLENLVEKKLASGEQPSLAGLACLASYKPLYGYPWINSVILPTKMKELESRQIREPQEEINLRPQVPRFKEVTDTVSSKVKKQYEENPYPRWINLGMPLSPKPVSNIPKRASLRLVHSDITQVSSPEVLIAGCGTGQHSISTSSEIENSQLLAIDLSFSSIAYAKRKTEEMGITNIEYMQADILDLGELSRRFDIVESAGVLHHMEDPMAGWKVLVDCLKPDGLMKIALYSTLARQNIAKVREEIAQLPIGSCDKDLRFFRKKIINSGEEHHKAVSKFKDFYSLSSYRDLIFHEQEHTFTIPQIQDCLDQLGLVFCGFENKEAVNRFKSKNPCKNSLYDLQEWRSFEEEDPDIFSGMYQFWCQKI